MAFFKQAKDYAPSFAAFVGEVYTIPNDDEPSLLHLYHMASRGSISFLPTRYRLIQRGSHHMIK